MRINRQHIIKSKRIAVVFLSYDGVSSLYCGVGIVIRSHIISTFKACLTINEEIDIIIFNIDLGVNKSRLLNSLDSSLNDIKNRHKSKFNIIYKEVKYKNISWNHKLWNKASTQAAKFLKQINCQYLHMLVFAHDITFASVRSKLNDQKAINIRFIWVPHSLSYFFNDSTNKNNHRFLFEKDAISSFINAKDYICSLSNFCKNILISKYNVSPNSIISLPNRTLSFTELLISKPILNTLPISKIRESITYYITGRCAYQKGFDFALPVLLKILTKDKSLFLVINAPEGTGDYYYTHLIRQMISKFPSNQIFLIDEFIPGINEILFSKINRGAVIIPSRFECAPLVALECLTFRNSSTYILYNDIEPLTEILLNKPRTIKFDINFENSLFSAVHKVSLKDIPQMQRKTYHKKQLPSLTQEITDIISNTLL